MDKFYLFPSIFKYGVGVVDLIFFLTDVFASECKQLKKYISCSLLLKTMDYIFYNIKSLKFLVRQFTHKQLKLFVCTNKKTRFDVKIMYSKY